jgi:hypothetical protein
MDFAFNIIATQLRDPSDGVFRDVDWIKESWRQPDKFAAELICYHAALDPTPLKGTLESGYDFYHDLVLRHLHTERVALRWLDGTQRPMALTYAQLHALCNQCLADWLAQEVQVRDKLCVLAQLHPEPAEVVVPLLTALRMGLQVSLLPPEGPDFIARRLQALSPRWVATEPRYVPLLRGSQWAKKVLKSRRTVPVFGEQASAYSFTYERNMVALQLFSPLHDPPDRPSEVSAAEAYHGALRDGLLLLSLQSGAVVAAAAQSLLQFQPALLFATLLRGATFLHLRAQDFERDTQLLSPLSRLPPIQVLFVSEAFRDVMLEIAPHPILRGLRLWVNNLQEESDSTLWSDFIDRWGLQSTPAMSVLFDAACGGVVLFSLRRLGRPNRYIMPAPGRPFVLLQPDGTGDTARGGYGIFRPCPNATTLHLLQDDAGYRYGGTREVTEAGHVYPKQEVEEAVADLPFVRGASVIKEKGPGRSTLLIFTGPETRAFAQRYIEPRQRRLQDTIVQRLSPDYLPARMIITSQLPRLLDSGKIDHTWCAQMLLTGELRRRADNPIFALFDRLLQALQPALLQAQRKKR